MIIIAFVKLCEEVILKSKLLLYIIWCLDWRGDWIPYIQYSETNVFPYLFGDKEENKRLLSVMQLFSP